MDKILGKWGMGKGVRMGMGKEKGKEKRRCPDESPIPAAFISMMCYIFFPTSPFEKSYKVTTKPMYIFILTILVGIT